VGLALHAVRSPRIEWKPYDLDYPRHDLHKEDFKIEVKASAYCQSWHQKQLSTIRFRIARTRYWNAEKGQFEGEPNRWADVYVFCIYAEQDWEMRVCSISRLGSSTSSQPKH
jgi:hypothetical protein